MTRRLLPAVLAVGLAGVAVAAFGYTRFAAPEPEPVAVESDHQCSSCDARHANKKRLSEIREAASE